MRTCSITRSLEEALDLSKCNSVAHSSTTREEEESLTEELLTNVSLTDRETVVEPLVEAVEYETLFGTSQYVTKSEFNSLKYQVQQLLERNKPVNESINLKKEIASLKSEIESKNTIINILQDTVKSLERDKAKNSTKFEHPSDAFNNPKRFAKRINNNGIMASNDIPTSNRYSCLDIEDTEIYTSGENHDAYKRNQRKSTKKNNRIENKNKAITIIGDSLLKDAKAHKMKKTVNNRANFYVKSFPGATIEDMESYIIPTKKRKPDITILHCGTNNLRNEFEKPKEIADKIIELAKSMHTDDTTVIISGLAPRNDRLDRKRVEVNQNLKTESYRHNIAYVDHENIEKNKHLNRSGLHLNAT